MAIRAGIQPTVRVQLNRGMQVDATDSGGRTALALAATYRHEGIRRLLLLESGVDPHAGDLQGGDAFSYALKSNNVGILTLLVQHRWCINRPPKQQNCSIVGENLNT